jgi:hypothetical protein
MVKNQKNKINLVTWNSINKCILMNKKINNILGQKKKKIDIFMRRNLLFNNQHGLISSPTPKLLAGNIRALKVRRSKSSPFAVHRSKPYQLLRRSPSFVCFNHNSRTEQLQCSPSRSPLFVLRSENQPHRFSIFICGLRKS